MKHFILPLICALTLTACETLGLGETEDQPLEGDRLSLYDFEQTLQKAPNTRFGLDGSENATVIDLSPNLEGGTDTAMQLAPLWNNKFWPQVGGYATHSMRHVAFNEGQPKRLWRADIGRGATKNRPLTGAPVMADGKVFTLNNDAEVIAFDANNGKRLWEQSVLKPGEDEVVIGGGVAFSGGRIFVTNGFNEVVALNANNGDILWRADTKTPVRAAPAAIPNRVFITTMDNEAIALDARTGQKIWSHRGLTGETGVLGAATPAITRDAVITAYSSGEVYALQIDTGMPLWSENLSPLARRAGSTAISDIRALPVFADNVVYAASYSNRFNAIDARTGRTFWQIPLGTGSTPWVSGNRVFMIESQGSLVSVNRQDGSALWQVSLPAFEDENDMDDPISWHGPYLAGGRLLLFGTHGLARSYNPANGEMMREWRLGDSIRLPIAIANGVLYALDNDGTLSAWQ